jgi:diguanylate cyclase (GGDEF)-like protein/PAS domain S-box-containing protein
LPNYNDAEYDKSVFAPRNIVMKTRPSLPSAISPAAIKARSFDFQRSLLHAVVESSPDGILVVDEHDMIVSVNERFLDAWGIPRESVCGGEASTVIGTSDQPILRMAVERVLDPQAFLDRVKQLYNDPNLDDHCEIALKDGRTLDRHSTVLRGEMGEYLGRVWFFRDITTRKQAEAELWDLARRDALTGVANRRYFFERGNEEFARARRHNHSLSILTIDLDNFKQINDRHGHAAGDQVLKSLCECCMTVMRNSDVFARTGGEEFCALLPHADIAEAQFIAERLRQLVMAQKLSVEKDTISYTISGGVACLNLTDVVLEGLLRRSDDALYRAKTKGKNRIEVAAS